MKRTFFEQIGLADMERVHSQMLQWIFSIECDAITNANKLSLIKGLFGLDVSSINEVYTEYHNIDILIKTPEIIICIENKLKSSQHSNQLETYKKTLNSEFISQVVRFYYLTLANENSDDIDWICLSYRHLLNELRKVFITSKTSFYGQIFSEYLTTLDNIVSTAEDFLSSPQSYNIVFSDGSKKKAHKIKNSIYSRQELISANQLETIFQKLYFRAVLNEIGYQRDYFITETRGNAILGIVIKRSVKLMYKGAKDRLDFSMQFQNGGFKTFCVSENYVTSSKNDIPPEITSAFDSLSILYAHTGYIKVSNAPRSKAQCSVTKRINNWGSFSVKDFAILFLKELEISKIIINEYLLPSLEVDEFI
ncbi:PD-(D/E)XK nuclease family protein [Pedobacter sp. L105]|uniref:PD-(D/E)XK nuclease family protein n=1 Tax=Pedobacter sp. L105 TaxID=1641871 RepID=UPI00131E44EC|nr:PD-(D/E)XK nuclease family protein [Pedobacter sp. L105]